MKYLFINSVYGVRSTGKIVAEQCHRLQDEGHQCLVAYGRESIEDIKVQQIQIGKKIDYLQHAVLSRMFDLQGFSSKRATKEFLREIEVYSPDVIWLHNLHGYYINIELLFSWIKKHPRVKVFWTLHDCWALTGHCAYFTMEKCEKWKKSCEKCSQLKSYPKTYGIGRTKKNYFLKKKIFNGVSDLTLITPSKWLADITRESILSEYPVKVINNSINKEVFRPTEGKFREKYMLENRYIVLGVAVGWEKTKGYPDMLELRKILSEKYVIVLVGVSEKQKRHLPEGIIGIVRTSNQHELVEIYSSSDVFVNPTHQDNYPTVNLEAAACGTPVITYNVGGSPESVLKENIIPENDIKGIARRIRELCEEKDLENINE